MEDLCYHLPVMPKEVVEGLNIRNHGVYVDATLGGGGHASLILQQLKTGRLLGIDRDTDALAENEKNFERKNFTAVHGNFHALPEILEERGIQKIDGILMDLGVSSHQLDTPERGFSYRFDGPLDMRMNQQQKTTAADMVNTYPEKELTRILYQYGEERHAPRIVRAMIKARENEPIRRTAQLVEIIESALPAAARYGEKHPSMRTFMALRIAVNDELAPLERTLLFLPNVLNPGGRAVIITFHSLEDRIVKKTFRQMANPCTCPRDIPFCACGKVPTMQVITRSPIVPGEDEQTRNSRAKSAKLRIAEKL